VAVVAVITDGNVASERPFRRLDFARVSGKTLTLPGIRNPNRFTVGRTRSRSMTTAPDPLRDDRRRQMSASTWVSEG
jgi:hypothetical protein